MQQQTYIGIDKDINGGMTHIARVIRDAWVFGLLPEGDTFANKSASDFQILLGQVNAEWDKYGQLPSKLPAELAEKHMRIYQAAMTHARQNGWDPELAEDD